MKNPFHALKYIPVLLYVCLFFVIFSSCENREKKLKKQNLKGEYIIRRHQDYFFSPPLPIPYERELYPWEKNRINGNFCITKDYFRCKGNQLNKVLIQEKNGKEKIFFHDCGGAKTHGLPIKEGKEFIYPCLIELLNYVQAKTGKKVMITTGHRCPQHNTYCDPTPSNFGSKHMIGAEVDFYVEFMENEPEKIVELLQMYYMEKFPGKKDFETFQKYEKEGLNVKKPPIFNKEIFIKLYASDEGRDVDNQHPYPYIGIQVRWDRERDEKVVFDRKGAENYLRH